MLMALLGKMGESLYHVGLQGNRVLMALAEVLICVAFDPPRCPRRPASSPNFPRSRANAAFTRAKIFSARYFATQVLPRLSFDRRQVEASDLAPMNLPVSAF